MRKYKYRATKFQRVNWERVREQATDGRVILTTDVAEAEREVIRRLAADMLDARAWCRASGH